MRRLFPLLAWAVTTLFAAEVDVSVAAWPGNAKAAWTCTFDDAIRDQYTFAAPRLKKYDLPATFFVLGWTAKTREEAERKKPGSWGGITWEEMRELITQGHEIGNHSWSHHDLRKLPEEKLEREIEGAQNRIALNVGVTPTTFCFPFNGMNEELKQRVARTHLAWRTNYRQFGGGIRADRASKWLDEEETRAGWTVLMVHGLLNGYDALKDPAQFDAHLKEVAKRRDAGDLWPATFRDAAAYKAMRESVELTVQKKSDTEVMVNVQSKLEEKRQVPLTLIIQGAPKSLTVRKGDHPLEVTWKEGNALVETVEGTLRMAY